MYYMRFKITFGKKMSSQKLSKYNIVAEDSETEEHNIVLMRENIGTRDLCDGSSSICSHWYSLHKNSYGRTFIYLSENSVKNIKIFKSNTKFKFGDGEQVTATKRVILPAYIAGKHCEIDVKIVNENIPLLLSKTSLKGCNAILDMINDKATIFGKEVDLHFSTSGP